MTFAVGVFFVVRKGLMRSFCDDLTDVEINLGQTLQTLKARLGSPGGIARSAVRALELGKVPEAATAYLERMGLANPQTLSERMTCRMIVAELMAEGYL